MRYRDYFQFGIRNCCNIPRNVRKSHQEDEGEPRPMVGRESRLAGQAGQVTSSKLTSTPKRERTRTTVLATSSHDIETLKWINADFFSTAIECSTLQTGLCTCVELMSSPTLVPTCSRPAFPNSLFVPHSHLYDYAPSASNQTADTMRFFRHYILTLSCPSRPSRLILWTDVWSLRSRMSAVVRSSSAIDLKS